MRARLRDVARDLALRGMALGRRIDNGGNWIRFPYYHHVFEDERAGFQTQLQYFRELGEFISIDAAMNLLDSGAHIDGRYFCLTFDDGFKSCLTGALPVLNELDAPAAFYVVSSLMGQTLPPDDPVARDMFGFLGRDTGLGFLSWEDCRAMAEAGMTIGSHSRTHPRLGSLSEAEIRGELAGSREEIEAQLGRECIHFCAPYGDMAGPALADLAREAGYRSMASGGRGPALAGDDPFHLSRDHMMANWGFHQLRYFLSRP